VKIPASIVDLALDSGAVLFLRINTPVGNYEMPLKEFVLDDLAKSLTTTIDKLSFYVYFKKADEQTQLSFSTELDNLGAIQLSPLRTVYVDAESDAGSNQKVQTYLSNFANRTLDTTSTLPSNRLTVMQFDPLAKRLSFAPAVFTTANKKSTATIKLTNHPLFAIVDSSRTFADLTNVPAKSSIELLASKRVVNGISNTRFGPNLRVTRAEFATMLVNALGLSPDVDAAEDFGDVWKTHWFNGTVGAALKYKLVAGMSDGTFRPFDPISRQQMAVMLGNAMRFAKSEVFMTTTQINNQLGIYTDRKTIGNWARSDLARLLRIGAVKGTRTTNGWTLNPNQNVSRAEVAAAINVVLNSAKLMN
jgi:hypothetical protein